MIRSRVVLPEPDGPSSATNSPSVDLERDVVERRIWPEKLFDTMSSIVDRHSQCPDAAELRRGAAIRGSVLSSKRDQREQREQRRDGEGGDEIIFIVEHLDMERHGVGFAADMARNDRDRAEFAHRAGVAQQHAVEQRPSGCWAGSRAQKVCQPVAPSDSAASSSARPCAVISGISSRATNGKVTKIVASDDAGQREDDLDVMVLRASAEPAMRAEQQHIDQARDDRRDRKGQVDQGDQYRPCRGSRAW